MKLKMNASVMQCSKFNNNTLVEFYEKFETILNNVKPLMQSCIQYIQGDGNKKNQVAQLYVDYMNIQAEVMEGLYIKLLGKLEQWIWSQGELLYGNQSNFLNCVCKYNQRVSTTNSNHSPVSNIIKTVVGNKSISNTASGIGCDSGHTATS